MKANSFGSNLAGIGLDERYQDADNTYTFLYYELGQILKIQKSIGGSISNIVTKAYTFNTGTWYDFKAIVYGNMLELWVNGVKELSATDSSLAASKIGVYSHRADSRYDDVMVQLKKS